MTYLISQTNVVFEDEGVSYPGWKIVLPNGMTEEYLDLSDAIEMCIRWSKGHDAKIIVS